MTNELEGLRPLVPAADASNGSEQAQVAPVRVIMDTVFLNQTSFHDPSFLRLLALAKSDRLTIHASMIVIEERRTQIVNKICSALDNARKNLEAAQSPEWALVTDGLPPQARLWDNEEIERRSRLGMDKFVADNKIKVVGYGEDHAARAWRRYFAGEPPFRSLKFRPDIPDCWIYEAGVDVAAMGGSLYALCGDKSDAFLVPALERRGYTICSSIEQLFTHLGASFLEIAGAAAANQPFVPSNGFDSAEEEVLGFVTYFRGPAKERLFDLLLSAGMSRDVAEGAVFRLIQSQNLRDTGSHLLPAGGADGERAAQKVEPLVINLLTDDGS